MLCNNKLPNRQAFELNNRHKSNLWKLLLLCVGENYLGISENFDWEISINFHAARAPSFRSVRFCCVCDKVVSVRGREKVQFAVSWGSAVLCAVLIFVLVRTLLCTQSRILLTCRPSFAAADLLKSRCVSYKSAGYVRKRCDWSGRI